MEIKERFFPKTKKSFFLFGPRGTGKSTWLKSNFPDSLYIDLLSPETFRLYSAKPERLADLVEGNPDQNIVIVDEVQKIPLLLNTVHQLIESKRGLQFILTGSSSRKLKRAGTDLLAGRVLLKTAHAFMASEIGESFNIEEALQYGLLPLVLDSNDPSEILRAYASLYLREEVQMEGLVRNVGNFSRFLETISFSHGSLLNTSGVARECSVGRKTVEGYVDILEDLLLSFRVPAFTKRARRHLSVHPKFYYFDTGVFRSLRPTGPLDTPEEISGPALEGLIAQHLRAWNAYSGDICNLYYWRTKAGREVDFIIYGANEFSAIEVKNNRRVYDKDLKGLLAFSQDYPEARLIMLYRGTEKLKIKGVQCVPCEHFLKKIVPGKPLLS